MIRIGRVIKLDASTHTADVMLSDTGAIVRACRIMSYSAASNSGVMNLPEPGAVTETGMPKDRARYSIALVGFVENHPVILGFLHPIESELRLEDKGRMMDRHGSDVYRTLDQHGNMELHHPSGLYIRIATDTASEDIAAIGGTTPWQIKHNLDKQVHLHIEQAGGKATIDIAPDGAITITTATTVTVNATGNATVTSGGNVEVNASGTAKVIAGGKATVKGSAIDLDAGAMKGIVQGDCICSFTGAPHAQFSSTVKASI